MTKQVQNHFRHVLALGSRLKYVSWQLNGRRNDIELTLLTGPVISVRGARTDIGVARDIFLRNCYSPPRSLDFQVDRIVDLGANVGYSCLYWLTKWPEASVTAFEPHPDHLEELRRNLDRNNVRTNVSIVAAAAGVASTDASLSDHGSSSAVTESGRGMAICVENVFDYIDGTVDLLKIDIEGGEYEIVGDPRFEKLDIRCLVVEWHGEPGETWLVDRLKSLDFIVERGVQDPPDAGVLWAFAQ